MRLVLTLFTLVLSTLALHAQSPVSGPDQSIAQHDPLLRNWQAAWITHPTAPLREPLVLHFRS
jgi:hypothetical protein